MKLSTKLREHMERLGLSQEKLAEHLGVSQSLVSKWKRGRGMPKASEVRAMATLFGVTCDYLLDDDLPVMGPEETEYDREVRRIARKVGPKQVWEILMGRLGQADPAGAPGGLPAITPRPDDGRRVARPGPDSPPSVPRGGRKRDGSA
jgi:transcriptional regulator with XRE-family HTH domain